MNEEKLKYPVGPFAEPASYSKEFLKDCIYQIKVLPAAVRELVTGRTEGQMNISYRFGGWTFRQIIHHLADSHIHGLIRIKYTLAEMNPTVSPFEEADWALLPDYSLPVECSLKMLEGIHQHMVCLFENCSDKDWERTYIHPSTGKENSLRKLLAIYTWHGKHHLAHLKLIVSQALGDY